MTLFLYSLLALPLWLVFWVLYFGLRREKLFSLSLLPKCAGTFLAVASAAIAISMQDKNPLGTAVFWFFVFCTIGDALLELNFVIGMLTFGVGHLFLVITMCGVTPPGWPNFIIWAVAMVIGLIIFRRDLPNLRILAIPCVAYAALLSGTLAMSLPAPILTGDMSLWPRAIGALLFFVSDLLVAKSEFSQWGDRYQKFIMFTYWVAHFLIAMPLWA